RLGPDYQPTALTDARGDCTVRIDPAEANFFLLKASKPSRVPAGISLIDEQEEPLPRPVVLKLARGTEVGGVVKNEQGEPVAGARIELDVPPKEGSAAELITGVVATTGPDGRWSFDGVPADAELVVAMASHPDYVGPFAGSPDTGWGSIDALRRGEAVTVLMRGVPL